MQGGTPAAVPPVSHSADRRDGHPPYVPTFLSRPLKILGLQPGVLSDPSQHSRPNLIAVVKCENEILKPWLG